MIQWFKTPEELLSDLRVAPEGYEVLQGPGYIYWVPENWEGGIALCAHVDTVWDHKPEIKIDKRGIVTSRIAGRGIGADDRAGVSIAIEAATTIPGKFAFLFFDGEESGCAVSRTVVIPFAAKIEGFVGLDRRGTDHIALYGHDNLVIRNAFTAFGGRLQQGSFTDCSMLASRFNKCCVNLSVGFMDEHTAHESWHPQGALFALGILKRVDQHLFRDQKPEVYNSYRSYGYGCGWRDDYDDGGYSGTRSVRQHSRVKSDYQRSTNTGRSYDGTNYVVDKNGIYIEERNSRRYYRRNRGVLVSPSIYDGWSDNDDEFLTGFRLEAADGVTDLTNQVRHAAGSVKKSDNKVLALPSPKSGKRLTPMEPEEDVYHAHEWGIDKHTGRWVERITRPEKSKRRSRRKGDPDWMRNWDY